MVSTPSLADQMDRVAQRLTQDYSGTVPDPVVRDLIAEAYGQMQPARVTTYVPVLVERTVRARLRSDRTPDSG